MAFNGKVALITGGASGIGRVHAMQLAGQGSQVAIVDIDQKGLEECAYGRDNIIAFECDVRNLADVQKLVAKVEGEIGAIDRMIHCAAIMPGGLLNETPAEQVSEIMTTNYTGMVNVSQTVLPCMLKRNAGDFIVYGSVAGIVVTNRFGAYGATKAATNFYMKVLMHENRNTNIRFLLVCPPAVDTPLINQAREKGPLFLKDIQVTRKNLVSPELVVDSVEKCLEKGIEINYPGPAKLIRILHPVFPNLVTRIVNKKIKFKCNQTGTPPPARWDI